eukprot:9417444-Pyramimonas_sp.AAC.1
MRPVVLVGAPALALRPRPRRPPGMQPGVVAPPRGHCTGRCARAGTGSDKNDDAERGGAFSGLLLKWVDNVDMPAPDSK